MTTVAFFDSKPCDGQYFGSAFESSRIQCRFHKFRLTTETAASADGAEAVCVFVN